MGSKVRGVHPIEFQRKICSLGLGGNSPNFALNRGEERKTHKNLSRGDVAVFIDLKQREKKMEKNSTERKEEETKSGMKDK